MGIYARPRRRRRTGYRVRKGRFIPFLTLLVLLTAAGVLLFLNVTSVFSSYTPDDFYPDHLLMYFTVEMDQGVPWYYLAAIDIVEDIPFDEISSGRSSQIALQLTGLRQDNQLADFLKAYRNEGSFIREVTREAAKLDGLRAIVDDKIFPIVTEAAYTYEDGFGAGRSYGGPRSHEGIDIMCGMDVPIVSVGAGIIEQVGWNEYGGMRIGIRGKDDVYYYYAHMSRYEGRPQKGDKVARDQIIGYVGDSGYGPEGTTGKFAPHLHFGMYTGKGSSLEAFNPYPFLKMWEYQLK